MGVVGGREWAWPGGGGAAAGGARAPAAIGAAPPDGAFNGNRDGGLAAPIVLVIALIERSPCKC